MREEQEVFVWGRHRFDISRLLADLKDGRLKPKQVNLGPEFINGYAEKVLCLNKEARDKQTRFGLMVSVNARHALELPEAALGVPLVILNAGKDKGLLNFDGDNAHLLADGNHRLSRAFFDDRGPLKAWFLSEGQSKRYRM